MNPKLYYLPFGNDLRHEVRFNDHTPTQEEFEEQYDRIGVDEELTIDEHATVGDALDAVWERWNRGSMKECSAFLTLSCTDCDETFEGAGREQRSKEHEEHTGHTVDGTRSLSTADIVVIDGEAYICDRFGWSRIESLNADVEMDVGRERETDVQIT